MSVDPAESQDAMLYLDFEQCHLVYHVAGILLAFLFRHDEMSYDVPMLLLNPTEQGTSLDLDRGVEVAYLEELDYDVKWAGYLLEI